MLMTMPILMTKPEMSAVPTHGDTEVTIGRRKISPSRAANSEPARSGADVALYKSIQSDFDHFAQCL